MFHFTDEEVLRLVTLPRGQIVAVVFEVTLVLRRLKI